MEAKSILSSAVMVLQLCLAFWQIVKLTPFGAFIQCLTGWLLQPLGLSKPYSRLKCFPGRVYKEVRCHVTNPSDQPQPKLTRQMMSDEISDQIESSYLGVDFHMERRGKNMLLLDGQMTYYTTDSIWYSLLKMGEAAPKTVFLEGYKEFWQQVATGGAMSLSQVLDRLILDNHTIMVLDNDLLLPVNLSL